MPPLSACNPSNSGTVMHPVPTWCLSSKLTLLITPPAGSFRLHPAACLFHPSFYPASQQALDSDWCKTDAKGGGVVGVVGQIQPNVGFACVRYISISRGTDQRGPFFLSLHHFLLALGTVLHSPSTPFSCSHCPHMNAGNHT